MNGWMDGYICSFIHCNDEGGGGGVQMGMSCAK